MDDPDDLRRSLDEARAAMEETREAMRQNYEVLAASFTRALETIPPMLVVTRELVKALAEVSEERRRTEKHADPAQARFEMATLQAVVRLENEVLSLRTELKQTVQKRGPGSIAELVDYPSITTVDELF